MRPCTLVLVIGMALFGPWNSAIAAQAPSPDDWRQVDTSATGTRLVVTLASGKERIGRFRSATADTLTIDVAAREGATEPLSLRPTATTTLSFGKGRLVRGPAGTTRSTSRPPKSGWWSGRDAEVAVTRGLVVVPSIRYHRVDDGLSSTSFGIGAAWRFPR